MTALLLLCGCGYRFVTGQASLPDGGRVLAIPQAKNETTEPAAGALLVEALRREAERAGLQVQGEAAAVLQARVVRLESLVESATMLGGRYHSRQQRLLLVADFVLRRGSAAPLWRERLSESVRYLSAPDLRGSEANRQVALRDAVGRMAREVFQQLTARY